MGEVDWNELQNNLEATIPVYDRINRFATVGQVSRWRRMVADRLPKEGKILEIGCGPGSFAEIVEGRDLVCLDPIPSMIAAAEPRVNSKRRGRGDSEASFVKGEAEALPFDDSTFDGVCSLFSLLHFSTFCNCPFLVSLFFLLSHLALFTPGSSKPNNILVNNIYF